MDLMVKLPPTQRGMWLSGERYIRKQSKPSKMLK